MEWGEYVVEIKLNNGKIIRKSESWEGSWEKTLIKIMRTATKDLGHIPSQEEARKHPLMPKDLSLYDKYCISYNWAMGEVRRSWSEISWRKMTPEEKVELDRAEAKKIKTSIVNEIFTRKPYWWLDEKEAQKMTESKEKKQEACKEVLMAFAKENLRWPTFKEINDFRSNNSPGWPWGAAVVRNWFGTQQEWAEQFFPEGLPEGFVSSNKGRRAKKPTPVPAKEVSTKETTPTSETPMADIALQLISIDELKDRAEQIAKLITDGSLDNIIKTATDLQIKSNFRAEYLGKTITLMFEVE